MVSYNNMIQNVYLLFLSIMILPFFIQKQVINLIFIFRI